MTSTNKYLTINVSCFPNEEVDSGNHKEKKGCRIENTYVEKLEGSREHSSKRLLFYDVTNRSSSISGYC